MSYQAAKEGWVVQDPWGHIPYFDVEWEFLGRQGKHLCLVSFEGRKLKDYSKWFAQSLREPPTAEEYSNEWCQKLVAFIHECDLMFEYKNIASEFEYLALFRFYCRIEEIEEQTKKMLKETAERQFWAERDVMTTKETP